MGFFHDLVVTAAPFRFDRHDEKGTEGFTEEDGTDAGQEIDFAGVFEDEDFVA